MKRISIIICFLLAALGQAQEKNTQIKVAGYAVHVDQTPSFRAIVALSPNFSSLPPESIQIEALKRNFEEMLQEKGIDRGLLSENPYDFGFETMGYEKPGILYEFRTTSIDEIRKFLAIKIPGLQHMRSNAYMVLDTSELEQLSEKALANAQEKAQALANAMGKKLGKIEEIEDFNNRYGEKIETSLYYDLPYAEYKYYIQVAYSIN